MAEVPQHPFAASIAEHIAIEGDRMLIDPDQLRILAERALALPASAREQAAPYLLLLMGTATRELADQLPDQGSMLVAQLAVLLAVLLDDARAAQALDLAGITVDVKAKLGIEHQLRPVGTEPRPPGALSPLGVRLLRPDGDS